MNFNIFPKLDDFSQKKEYWQSFLHFGEICTKETLIKRGRNAYFVDKINEDIMQIIWVHAQSYNMIIII